MSSEINRLELTRFTMKVDQAIDEVEKSRMGETRVGSTVSAEAPVGNETKLPVIIGEKLSSKMVILKKESAVALIFSNAVVCASHFKINPTTVRQRVKDTQASNKVDNNGHTWHYINESEYQSLNVTK
jgi:hypothetical protein